MANLNLEIATLGGGCFWCLEAVFIDLKGVVEVIPGYAGGHVADPSYELVCTGTTDHAEVVQISYESDFISYGDLLTVFFSVHDPTTLNRQGNDVGTQYRSVIFYHNSEQQQVAQEVIETQQEMWSDPIVTQLVPLTKFYPAEAYHRQYFRNNPNQAYCQAVINPKVTQFRAKFADRLK